MHPQCFFCLSFHIQFTSISQASGDHFIRVLPPSNSPSFLVKGLRKESGSLYVASNLVLWQFPSFRSRLGFQRPRVKEEMKYWLRVLRRSQTRRLYLELSRFLGIFGTVKFYFYQVFIAASKMFSGRILKNCASLTTVFCNSYFCQLQ